MAYAFGGVCYDKEGPVGLVGTYMDTLMGDAIVGHSRVGIVVTDPMQPDFIAVFSEYRSAETPEYNTFVTFVGENYDKVNEILEKFRRSVKIEYPIRYHVDEKDESETMSMLMKSLFKRPVFH
jgi:hypothetical protein